MNKGKEKRSSISHNLGGPHNANSTSEKMPFGDPSPLVSEDNDIVPIKLLS